MLSQLFLLPAGLLASSSLLLLLLLVVRPRFKHAAAWLLHILQHVPVAADVLLLLVVVAAVGSGTGLLCGGIPVWALAAVL